jgi:phosphoglycerol transferase MdoB-like AlkP superfamily enzyme
MKQKKSVKKYILCLLLLLCGILAIAKRGGFYEDREYYAINFMDHTYDLMDQESQEIRQTFVAKQTELEKVYIRFHIEQLVDLKGRMIVSVQNSKGETMASYLKYLSTLTQTETAQWTEFPMSCELEKGEKYTLVIQTSDVSGDGVCSLYVSKNREFLFGNLELNGEEDSGRLETTFLFNTYCLDDLFKMLLLLAIAAVLVAASGRQKSGEMVRKVIGRLPGNPEVQSLNRLAARILLFLSPFVAYYIVQTFSGYDLFSFSEQLFDWTGLFNMLIYVLICLIFYVITNRTKYAAILTVAIAWVLGLVNYFVWDFRGCPIVAADLGSVQTAANVAGNYAYSLGMDAVWATVLLVVFVVLNLSLRSYGGLHWKRRLCLLLAWGTLLGGAWRLFFHSNVMKKLDITVSVWMPQRNYAQNGSALSFLLTWTYYIVEKPEGYSVEKVEEITEGYTSDPADDADDTGDDTEESVTPNVIAIMNESFSDLSVDSDIETSEDYMPFIHGLTENTVKGNLYVSVLGGNTANTEFEFQTGNSMAFFPSRSVPYNSYISCETGSLTWTLQNQGYTGIKAVHPYYSDGWNRETVYPLLGFQQFLSEANFTGSTYVRDFISDESDFDKLIDEYEQSRAESDDPFYIFSVTMQNHGGYAGTHGLVEEDIQVTKPENADDQMVQYLNLIRKSDEAFQKLTEYFEQVDEPTVIVMFGDHQPGFTDSVYDELMGESTDLLGITDTAKMYQTPYVIWANYDIEEETRDMSANYLSSYLLKLIGGKMTGYNKYLLDLMEKVPVLSAICYIGDDGVVYETGEESKYSELIRDYQNVQYNNMFDTDHRIEDFFFLKE